MMSVLVRLAGFVLTLLCSACATPTLPEPFAEIEFGYFQSDVQLYYALDLPEGVTRPPLIVLSHGSGRDNAAHNARFALPLVHAASPSSGSTSAVSGIRGVSTPRRPTT